MDYIMLYRPSNFRKSSRAVTAVAAVGLFVTASLAATGPASADSTNKDFAAACAAIKDVNQRAGCQIDAIKAHTVQVKKEGEEARAAGAAADKELKSVNQSEVCFAFLTKGRDEKKFTREAVLQAAGGRLTPDNSCNVARKFGFDQRASADAPRMQ
ncbi:hypothetical protein ACYCVF_35485 [Bradyrhizobium sp. 1.29L]